MGHKFTLLTVCLAAGLWAHSGSALAQVTNTSSTLIDTPIPDNYDRDRNISVIERARPDYDALGVPLSSFKIYPRLALGAGGTDNAFLSTTARQGDAFLSVAPQVRADSDWSRNEVSILASGFFSRYLQRPLRNQENYDIRARGRLEVNSELNVTGEAQYAQLTEQQDLGAISSDLAILSQYRRGFLSLLGDYSVGRSRLVVSADRTSLTFDPIDLGNSVRINQSDRDRIVTRVSAQGQFAISPSVSTYVQGTYAITDYSRPLLSGLENRDANSQRFIGGLNFDLAGFLRGKIGVGYARRNYDSALYGNVDGFSAEAKIEYFPTDLTTFTLNLARTIEDASISSNSAAYFDTRASVRVDHELLRNLLLNAYAEYTNQDYIGIDQRANGYRFSFGGRYLSSRRLSLEAGIQYFDRSAKGSGFTNDYSELRGQVAIVLQR